jgi:hypothetical protein
MVTSTAPSQKANALRREASAKRVFIDGSSAGGTGRPGIDLLYHGPACEGRGTLIAVSPALGSQKIHGRNCTQARN